MNLMYSRRQLFVVAVAIELIVFFGCYLSFDSMPEVFRYAARYSGRTSLLVYLGIFGYFLYYYRQCTGTHISEMKSFMQAFSIIHVIHFGFLAANVYINNIELVPFKLAGGILGYALIILYPFFIERIKNIKYHLIYFYYIGFIMIMTYVSRIKGDFELVTPSIIHCVGLGSVLAFIALSFVVLFQKPRY